MGRTAVEELEGTREEDWKEEVAEGSTEGAGKAAALTVVAEAVVEGVSVVRWSAIAAGARVDPLRSMKAVN